MKTSANLTLIASRHAVRAKAAPSLTLAQKALHLVKAGLGFIAREASPLAMPAHGFQPENGTLCGAHWNHIYLIHGAKL